MTCDQIIGRKFGRLTVLRRIGTDRFNMSKLECECECGNHVTVRISALTSLNTRSCGCLKKEVSRNNAGKISMKRQVNRLISKHLTNRMLWRDVLDQCGFTKEERNVCEKLKETIIAMSEKKTKEMMAYRDPKSSLDEIYHTPNTGSTSCV